MRRQSLALTCAAALPLWVGAQEVDHSEMNHDEAAAAPAPSDVPLEPRTPVPVLTDADRQAAIPVSVHHMAGDNAIHSYTLVNRLEGWDANPGTGLGWEAQGWIGQDINRLWWRTEGEWAGGETESADAEALYGRAFARWWEWVAGVRQDFKPGDGQTFAAFGVQGLAPQWFELSLTGYVGEGGQTALRVESEYEVLFSNRLILQPLLEVDLYGKNDAARGIGSGLSTTEVGLRLRYEFVRRLAPYVGVVYERVFGNTADLRRAHGEDVDEARVVAGVRLWF